MASFNSGNTEKKLGIPFVNGKKKEDTTGIVPTKPVTPSAFSMSNYTPTSTKFATSKTYMPLANYRFKKQDWSYLYREPTKAITEDVPADVPVIKSYSSVTDKLYSMSNVFAEAPVHNQYEAGAVAGIGYSVLASATDIVGDAVQFIAGGVNTIGVATKQAFGFTGEVIKTTQNPTTYSNDKGIYGKNTDTYTKQATEMSKELTALEKAGKKNTDEYRTLEKNYYDVYGARTFDINTGNYNELGIDSSGVKAIQNWTSKTTKDITSKADLQDESAGVQWTANMLGSIPYTAVSRIPLGVGVFLNYGSSYISSMQQKVAEAEAAGTPLTNEQKSDIMSYASSSALINAGTEQIFPAGKGALNLGKALATSSFKNIAKETTKFLLKQGMQEATEEGLSYIGQGIAAKMTTDPNATFLGVASQSALINLADLGNTMLSAFVMGITFSGVGIGGSVIKGDFKNTTEFYNQHQDDDVSKMTPEIIQEGETAFKTDLQNLRNKKLIQKQVAGALVQTEQNMPIQKQIEMQQNILQEEYKDDVTKMTPEAVVKHDNNVTALKETVAELQSQTRVTTSNGLQYTVEQMKTMIQNGEDALWKLRRDLLQATTEWDKAIIQEDIDIASAQLDSYKKSLTQSTQTPLTSKQMLANMQASKMPVAVSNVADSKVATPAVNAPTNVTESVQKASATALVQNIKEEYQVGDTVMKNGDPVVVVEVRKNAQFPEDTIYLMKTKDGLVAWKKATIDKYLNAAKEVATAKTVSIKAKTNAQTTADREYKRVSALYKTKEDVAKALNELLKQATAKSDRFTADGRRIMNMQLFALKKLLSTFPKAEQGYRLHGFIDSFSKVLQSGRSEDMVKFLQDNIAVDELFYEQMANTSEIAISDAMIDKKGDAGLEELYNDFINAPSTILLPNQVVSLSRYFDKLTRSEDVDLKSKGFKGIDELANRMTQAGRMGQSVRAVLKLFGADRQAKELTKEIDHKSSDPIDKADLKKAVAKTKKAVGDIVGGVTDKVIDGIDGIEYNMDKSDSAAVDEAVKNKGKKADLPTILSALIKKEIIGVKKKVSTEDNMALQILHSIYLELNPSSKGKETTVFNTLAIMSANKEKYGNVWDKAKPKVEAAIAAENLKREGTDLPQLIVPENYLDRFRDPDFTKRMMNQAIRQVLNYNRTSMKAEARKYYLEGGSGEQTINRFVSGLRDKFDDAYGEKMPDATFDYLKQHIVKQFKDAMVKSKDSISEVMRKQAQQTLDKNPIGRKARIDKVIDQLTDAVISGALSDDKLSTVWAKRMGLNYISDEMRVQISESIIEIDKIVDENERFLAYQDFVNKLGNQIKANNIMKLNAWRRFAMLCNPRTWTRNGASNYAYLPYAKVMDGLTYRLQKAMGLEQQYMARGERYLKRGANNEIDAVVDSMLTPAFIRTTMEENGKYSFGEHLKREGRIFQSDKLEALTKFPLYMISTGTLTKNGKHGIAFFGDQGILKTHLTAAFRNRLNALGYKESLSETVKADMKATALKYAKEVALTRTYRAASVISEWFSGLKVNVNNDSQIKGLVESGTTENLAKARQRRKHLNARNAAADFAVPFVVTPVAIAVEGYRYSPAALAISVFELAGMKIKKQTSQTHPYETARITKQISQALMGTAGQWVIGAALAFSGAITGAPPDSEKEKKEWALEGKTAYSVWVPGVGWISYAWCQPVAFGIMGGADIATVIKNGGYNPSAIPGALTAGLNGVVGATLYGNIVSNLFGGRTTVDNAKNFLTGGLTQTFPTLGKALAQSFDPYVRDTYSGNVAQALLYRVLSYIPIASMLQPVKVDIWGNPVKNPDAGMDIVGRSVLNILAPFTLAKAQTDPVSQEVIRLFNATKLNAALPVVVSASWGDYTGDKALTGQNYVDYQTLMGQYSFEYAQTVMADKRYENASDAEKVKILTNVYKKASKDAKAEYIKTHQ